MIGTVGFVFVGNLSVMIVIACQGFKHKMKLKKLKKKHAKRMKEIELAREKSQAEKTAQKEPHQTGGAPVDISGAEDNQLIPVVTVNHPHD